MNRQQGLVLALLVSLAINLLIAGFLIGRAGGRPPPAPPPMAWAAKELDPETRRIVRQQMRAKLPEIKPLRKEMASATAALRRAVTAEDFDPEALSDALARVREHSMRYQAFMHENLVEISAQLPRQQRIAVTRAILERDRDRKMPPQRNGNKNR